MARHRIPLWRNSVVMALFIAFATIAPTSFADEVSNAALLRKLESMEKRIEKLEAEKAQLEYSLQEPYISAEEPEVTARLKAVESQVNSYRHAARTVEALEGISANVGFTMAAQRLFDATDDSKDAELNYRGDATVALPAGSVGNANGFIFAHFRMGQGLGLENPGSAFSSVNSTSFQRPGTEASDSTVLLAQAWYQLDVPLPLGGNPDLSRKHIEFNFGKMDPFVFFDQNAIADDETRGFINQAFIHNPQLDVGGDIGVDEFGFTPGLRLAYRNDVYKPASYGFSLGVFGAGNGASFDDSFDSPFFIVQAETGQQFFSGLPGNYRLYYWRNGQGEDFDGAVHAHEGLGISIDQRIRDYAFLFGRYGTQTKGKVTFDQSLTLGAEFGGSYWKRGGDALGVAVGWLNTSSKFRRDSLTVDADGNGVPDYGYRASGSEQIAEVYYRYRLNNQFDLSPNLQYIRRPGGDGSADDVKAIGLRTQLNF